MICKPVLIKDNNEYQEAFRLMSENASDVLARKITSSLHQSAQILHWALKVLGDDKTKQILSAGSFDDVPTAVLKRMQFDVVEVDPAINYPLHRFKELNPNIKFDLIISTSVIEHVANDSEFIADICDLLSPNGIALVTCDFKPDFVPGQRVPSTSHRFYTKDSLSALAEIIKNKNCELTEIPNWDMNPKDVDFNWEGIDYCFAGISFKKC